MKSEQNWLRGFRGEVVYKMLTDGWRDTQAALEEVV